MPKAYQSTDTDVHATVARDAMGFSLRYHSQDYENIGGFNNAQQSRALDADLTGHRNLYNGNINHMVTALRDSSTGNASVQQTQYHYDQLNRITQMQVFRATNLLANNSWTGASSSTDYKSQYTYDPNGNLLSLIRNGASPGSLGMDSLTYRYLPGSNKLDHVDDGVADANYTLDVDDQDTLNYAYDAIGNLVADEAEEIDEIIWNVGGKIRHIKRTTASPKPDLEFRYGPDGNRYCKIVKPDGSDEDEWIYTYYFRDASGNIMATYQRSYTDPDSLPATWTSTSKSYTEIFATQEFALYGSERLGIFNQTDSLRVIAFNSPGFDTDGSFLDKTSLDTLSQPAPSDSCGIAFSRGGKRYELSNHLGNVLAVISDRKLQVLDANMTLGYYFTADIWASTDYFPFGSQMRERTWKVEVYRFDFNGKETDLETALQDYGFRIYNPGIAKFLSVDPLASEYPWYTPYQFAGNKPIVFVDIDGLEEGEKKESNANPKLTHVFIFVIDPQSSHDDRRLYEMRMPKQGKWFIIGAGSALKAQEKLAEALEDNDQKTVTTIVFFSHGTHRGDRANIKLNPVSSLENNATNYFDIQVYLDKVNETDKEKAFDPNDATTFKKYEHESGYEISVEKFEQINAFAKIVQSTSAEGCFYLLSCDIGYDDKLMELIHNSWLKKIEATLTSAKAIVNIRLRFYEDGKAKNRFFGYGSNLIKGATKGLVKTIDGEGKKSKADNIQLDNRKGKSPIEVIGKSSG